MVRRDLANHDCPNNSDSQVPNHEVGSCVAKVSTSSCSQKNEYELEAIGESLNKEGVQSGETEALDDNGAKLSSKLISICVWGSYLKTYALNSSIGDVSANLDYHQGPGLNIK